MKKALQIIPLLGIVAVGASACGAAQAKAPATRPALEVPPPPPRIVEPMPAAPAAPIEPVGDLPSAPPAASRPRPQPQARETAATRETSKPEPKPDPPPAPEPAAANPPPAQPPQIRTPGDNSEAARQVKETLDRSTKVLNSIDYRSLNRQRQENYNTAKGFIAMAEEALKTSNIDFAKYLAGKAEVLAKELQGR